MDKIKNKDTWCHPLKGGSREKTALPSPQNTSLPVISFSSVSSQQNVKALYPFQLKAVLGKNLFVSALATEEVRDIL